MMIPQTILGRRCAMRPEDRESEKEWMKFQRMLEDHRKLLYPHYTKTGQFRRPDLFSSA
jgi:hypothetical protein